MPRRDELKTIIDQMPPEKLDLVHMNLESILHPPVLDPQIEQIMRRSEQLQRELVNASPSCRLDANQGYTYSWFEGITHVTHRLMIHAGREMDIVERLQLTEDETMLIFEQEIYAEGRIVKRKEEFPVTPAGNLRKRARLSQPTIFGLPALFGSISKKKPVVGNFLSVSLAA
jgi:hypothetical protein